MNDFDWPPFKAHLAQGWPDKAQRDVVVEGYHSIALNKLLLADIALQGGVFLLNDGANDAWSHAVCYGRRQMALRILQATDADPNELNAYFARFQRPQKPQEENS